jgi:hypothetical protein
MNPMRSTMLTLRVKRGKDSVLTVESDSVPTTGRDPPQLPPVEDMEDHTDEPITLTAALHDARVCADSVSVDILQFPGAKEGDVAELAVQDTKKRLLFSVKPMNGELLRRSKTIQVSVMSGPLQQTLSLSARQPVTVTLRDKLAVEADLVEILIRDIHLSRGDMWMLSSTLTGSCVYNSQKITFIESIRGTVSTIYREGKKVFSAYIGSNTKVVFRSESARLVFLIQITQEMYHFQEDGEVMFHKIVNSLFPMIFKRWRDEGTHHLITIVFAANLDYSENSWTELKEGQRPTNIKDFYRVVVDQVNIVHWNEIMISLRYEFVNFRKDIMRHQLKQGDKTSHRFLPTIKSDILNTINLATTLVVDRFRDPDLRHTTSHFIVISAGNGLFDVGYDDLLDTGKRLLNSELSVDIVCLSQPPLHVSPLFRYRDHYGILHHCVPGWIDVSYWSEEIHRQLQWLPRCKIYELQMMGVMENEMNDVTVEHLNPMKKDSVMMMMDEYDKHVFSADVSREASRVQTLGPKKKQSKSTLLWKVTTNSPVAKTEVTETSPIFTVPDSAVSSLRQLGTISQERAVSSGHSDSTSVSSPSRSLRLSPRPPISRSKTTRIMATTATTSHQQQKEKITSLDSLKSVMWTEIGNLSRQLTKEQMKSLSVGKWQDVFPKFVKRRSIKWRSLSSPSELPITTPIFPPLDDFEANFTFQTHSVTLSPECEKYMTLADLMREMIYLRLMLGFQICYGETVEKVENKIQSEGNSGLLIKQLVPGHDVIGSRVYLSMDEEIHRISCDYDGTINVQRYNRVHSQDFFRNSFNRVMIKTRYQNNYHPYDPDPMVVKPRTFKWNHFDQRLAGFDEDEDESGYNKKTMNRIKFVLLPADIPKSTYLTSNDKLDILTPEETRVEGLRRLITVLHRGVFSPEGRTKKSTKEEIFPEINFYTGDLISFLREQFVNNGGFLKRVSSSPSVAEILNKDVTLSELSIQLQGPRGVKLIDRRWHWKVHKNCFRGVELVNWLLDHFNDINTRDEAVAYGNELMEQGLFVHVENRHKFLDGHYFYRIDYVPLKDEVNPRSRNASVGSKSSKNFAFTPVINPSEELKKPEGLNISTKMQKFVLSQSLKYDLDPSRNSYRREVMKVHYDNVHNPNHCFHIRLEWLTATPKLIEDTVNGWLRMCERYGLKLVETPWGELREVPHVNPFHSFVEIRLAVNPWDDPEFADPEIMKKHRFFYHIYLLEHSGFLMDNRASMFFRHEDDEFEIMYSWGRPEFKYAQYIHKTGAYMAEIRDDGDLFLAPNNTHIARVNVGNVSSQQQPPSFVLDSQKIMLAFRATCFDAKKLRRIFVEAKLNWGSSMMHNSTTLTPVGDDLTI